LDVRKPLRRERGRLEHSTSAFAIVKMRPFGSAFGVEELDGMLIRSVTVSLFWCLRNRFFVIVFLVVTIVLHPLFGRGIFFFLINRLSLWNILQVLGKANCLAVNIIAFFWTLVEGIPCVGIVVENLFVDIVIGMAPS
jgi:hypothetical protein